MEIDAPSSPVDMLVRKRWARSVAILLTLIAISIGVVLGYRAAKTWRAHYLMRAGADLVAAGKSSEGEPKLIAAYTLAPRDVEVVRAMASYEFSRHKPYALDFYRLLTTLPDATREDRRGAARAYLALQDTDDAQGLIDQLLATSPNPEDYSLAAEAAWQAGSRPAAIALMRKGLSQEPSSGPSRLILDQMLSQLPDAASQREAVNGLWALSSTNDAVSLKALEALASDPQPDANFERSVLQRLRRHPLLDNDGRFVAWDLEKRLGGRPANVIMAEVVAYFRTADIPARSAAARWLYNEGAPQSVLQLAMPPDTMASQELFLVRLDALGALNKWNEVEHELSNGAPLSPATLYLYRARADQELNNPGEASLDWNRARDAAVSERGMLAYVGQYAHKLGLYDEAKKTYLQMTRSQEQQLEGYLALLRIEAEHGTSAELLATLKQMTTDLPSRPEARNDWAYLTLLLDTNVDEAWKAASALVEADPKTQAYRSTLALGYLRKNRPDAAYKLYDPGIDWSAAAPSAKLVYAVVLAAEGEKDRASLLAGELDRSQLRPEELALLNSYLPQNNVTHATTGTIGTND